MTHDPDVTAVPNDAAVDRLSGGLEQMDKLRARIDELDEALVALLNERASCALDIGALKQSLGLEIYQPERESQVLRHVRSVNQGPLTLEAITRLFERIIDEARRLERLAQQHTAGASTPEDA
ncbi:MAG: chorismate mutase [Acidobacteria bacterium]|nr:chorismate mutase [Acidobacteriota bacterium]